ncbi:hypothetical protein A2866_03310 [Candidatus Roizmanbacteria bacterium RIFCSPHIGHO2_01_FULL_39_8]|uniref:50S ribosomal protein L19 n=2 Tax=Candidatus Roizmaniibacteriota TaxID=1752723 RepID=A0A1F7GTH9_9BACT|nr:MAG: hypothetical protein A2866_03310 [Candidatus Roizmanbacteria bacterium RIFCSPHIGHO2_01_FULL_39_8]OGK28184.1 MAG: hypothetical protein A3C28_01350 [Candidatus Roizmanbacteria bacterium RIFCSPHIGHO2_02_FULL_39_9]
MTMANSFIYKDKSFRIGSTVSLTYRFKEGDKERRQIFKGILLQVKGSTPQSKTITVRKISRSGIGIERIIPLASPFLEEIKLVKKTEPKKAKLYFLRGLSDQKVKAKLAR